MFVVSNFIMAIANVLDIVLNLFMWVVIIRALLSWVNPDPYNIIVRTLNNITEPVLAPIRRMLPMHTLMIDLSPIIVFIAIIFLRTFVVQSLYQLAQSL